MKNFSMWFAFIALLVAVVFPLHPSMADEAPVFATVTPEEGELVEDSPVGETPPDVGEGNILRLLSEYLPVDEIIANIASSYNSSFAIFALSIAGVVIGFGVALYRSIPSSVLDLLQRSEEYILQKKAEAASNNINWDDPIWQSIYEFHKQTKAKVEEVKNALDGTQSSAPPTGSL